MSTYAYSIARFVPDLIKNEPINIGILVQSLDNLTLQGKFIDDFTSLRRRFSESNIAALKTVIEGFRVKKNIDSKNFLFELSSNSNHNLRFTEPGALISGTSEIAIDELYQRYVGIKSKTQEKRKDRHYLQTVTTKAISKNLKRKWVARHYPVEGPIDQFRFDFAFKNGKVRDLLHTISFAGDAERALTLTKALALTLEYAYKKNDDLDCATLVQPPKSKKMRNEFFEPAIAYLDDQKCKIKTEKEIPQYISNIKKKLSKIER